MLEDWFVLVGPGVAFAVMMSFLVGPAVKMVGMDSSHCLCPPPPLLTADGDGSNPPHAIHHVPRIQRLGLDPCASIYRAVDTALHRGPASCSSCPACRLEIKDTACHDTVFLQNYQGQEPNIKPLPVEDSHLTLLSAPYPTRLQSQCLVLPQGCMYMGNGQTTSRPSVPQPCGVGPGLARSGVDGFPKGGVPRLESGWMLGRAARWPWAADRQRVAAKI